MGLNIGWADAEERELENKVLKEYSPDRVRKDLEQLTQWVRLAGSDDQMKAAHYIRERLKEAGVDTEIHEVDAYISLPGKAKLEILSPLRITFPSLPRIFTSPTPPGGIRSEIVAVGKGSEQDFERTEVKGKIVLMEGNKARAIRIAAEKGAVAQIHVNPAQGRVIDFGSVRKTYGNPTPDMMDRILMPPALSICHEDGAVLIDLLKKGPVIASIEADSWSGYKKILLPVGTIRGMREPEKYVLLGGHYCSWSAGATDNAAANALMMEMARLFSKHRERLRRGLRIAWWSGHEQGAWAGSNWYADTFWEDLRDHAVAYCVMDGIGRRGSSSFKSQNTEEVRRFREAVIKEILGLEIRSERASKSGDQVFLGMGIPSFTGKPDLKVDRLSEDPKSEAAKHWYSHTAEDTLDKVDLEMIAIPFRVNAVSILRLCNNPVLPFDFITVAGVFEKRLQQLQTERGSTLDLTSVLNRLDLLKRKAAILDGRADKLLSDYESGRDDQEIQRQCDEINTCLMGLSRILLTALYTRSGKYEQDPSGSKFAPIPTLEPLEGLAAMDRTNDSYRALRASLVRARNRLSDQFTLADQLLLSSLDRLGHT